MAIISPNILRNCFSLGFGHIYAEKIASSSENTYVQAPSDSETMSKRIWLFLNFARNYVSHVLFRRSYVQSGGEIVSLSVLDSVHEIMSEMLAKLFPPSFRHNFVREFFECQRFSDGKSGTGEGISGSFFREIALYIFLTKSIFFHKMWTFLMRIVPKPFEILLHCFRQCCCSYYYSQ